MNSRIAIAQMKSTDDRKHNLEMIEKSCAEASGQGAVLLALPENFAHMPVHSHEAFSIAEPINGPWIHEYRALAQKYNLWLSLGGFKTPTQPPSNQLFNTHLLIDNRGVIKASYNKLHLFKIEKGNVTHDESQTTKAGSNLAVADSPAGKLGLAICYDIRFGEMFIRMAQAGAQIMLTPAAFFCDTGRDHWEVLLRARAIESQSYVVAAAQVGRHNPRRESYGHSMIVDPWGKVLAKIEVQEGVICADIDINKLEEVRKSIPVLSKRNCDGKVIVS